MTTARRDRNSATAGVEGWDAYAPFYDWENARTVGRRDVPFWRSLAAAENGPVLELGCGTGRITIPAARAGAHVVGVDRSAAMLERARSRVKRLKGAGSAALVRGDIRELPFRESNGPALSEPGESKGFSLVMAPYGILQSLTRVVGDRLAHRGQVGRHAADRLIATDAVAEPGDDLVEDQHDAARVAQPRRPSRNPGRGSRPPKLCGIGSRMIAATSSRCRASVARHRRDR